MNKSEIIAAIVIVIVIVAIGGYFYISSNTTDSKIEVLSNSTLDNGKYIEFDLKDEYRNVLPGEKVDVKILNDIGGATKSTVVTDQSGHATVALTGMENGNYTVHITYNGTMFHNPTKKVTSLNIDDGY